MSVVKRILCLANSKKMSGRCVAGREVQDTGPGPGSDQSTRGRQRKSPKTSVSTRTAATLECSTSSISR